MPPIDTPEPDVELITSADETSNTQMPSETMETQVVSFSNAAFEKAFREALSLADDEIITNDMLNSIKELDLSDKGLSNISGIEYFKELTMLSLRFNEISDISALGNLTNLQTLYLYNNSISSISALGNLTNLQTLYLSANEISDISALRSLTNLEQLDLDANEISDISALGNLSGLSWLDLSNNNLTEQQVEELRRKLPQAEILTE